MIRALIAGADGQIGRALRAPMPPGVEALALGRDRLDLRREAEVATVVRDFRPHLVINAAGYTAVDRAEEEQWLAHAVNAEGAERLARAAKEAGARLLHFSTDYVFDGRQDRPYRPSDRPNPLNVYGATKLAGERAVLELLPGRSVVLRTAWVYASRGRNFLLTMLRLMKEKERVQVVSDQIGTPTSAASAARAAWAIATRGDVHGVLHWTDDGTASWYDLAVAIFEEGRALGLVQRDVTVQQISTQDYPTLARRPRYSVLDCSGARAATGLTPDHWRTALRRTMTAIAYG